jgi:hypothetical protein
LELKRNLLQREGVWPQRRSYCAEVIRTMKNNRWFVAGMVLVIGTVGFAAARGRFSDEFMLERCGGFSTEGANPYLILEPGFELVLEGREDGKDARVEILVSDETEMVDGIETRVVIESEYEDNEIVEISRNFMALCNRDNSVVYFGEDVDNYDDGQVVNHNGSWRVGQNGASAGLLMPGTLVVGSRYFQEIAKADDAFDRAEILSTEVEFVTPAGTFTNCLKTRESSPLEPGKHELKHYAPGIGLIQDAKLKLTSYSSRR